MLAGPSEEEFAAPQDANGDTGDDAAALPDYEDSPSVVPLPQLRPRDRRDSKPAAETEKANVQQVDEPNTPKADETAKERETPKPRQLAYARPANPAEKKSGGSLGGALRNLFGGGAKAGHGVAVYDISAAKVYMPDGSVLEAHSGIGKMADNPRYVNVKMNGPTPPHTYDLKMREKRFHGVEALRMLPVDGKNRNGRDGLLDPQLPAARRAGRIAWLRRLQGLRPFPQRIQAGQSQATRRGTERRTGKRSPCLRRQQHLTDSTPPPQPAT